jgi:hypothetical protein
MKAAQFTALLTALFSLMSATPARADHVAEADQLFRDGVELMRADNCPDAIPKFFNSAQLDRSAGALVNLATCYARLGRTASAYRAYRHGQDAAIEEGNPQLRDRAAQGMSRLEPVLSRLVIVPPRTTGPVSLRLNGEPLLLSDTDPVPLDPGDNTIEAAIPGRIAWRHRVVVTERGSTIVVQVPELPELTPRVEPANWRTGAVVLGGAGLASIVLGSIMAVSAEVSEKQSAAGCPGDCNAEGNSLREAALRKARVSTWLVGTGALLTGGGIALWVASPAQRSTATVSPWLGAQGGVLSLSLRGSL